MMHRLGIKARVLLLAILPITVISVALTWHFIAIQLQDMDRAIEDLAKSWPASWPRPVNTDLRIQIVHRRGETVA